jgi:hypothetical protein
MANTSVQILLDLTHAKLFLTLHLLQHRLDLIRDLERRLSLALDLVNRNTIRQLDQRQPISEVDIKNTLPIMLALLSLSHRQRANLPDQ